MDDLFQEEGRCAEIIYKIKTIIRYTDLFPLQTAGEVDKCSKLCTSKMSSPYVTIFSFKWVIHPYK